jgi:hypothetical protein
MSVAVLDVQGMDEEPVSGRVAGHSGASKNCGNHFSGLSLLLCG